MEIRIADTKDAEAIREIYAPYVLNTAVSFEYEVPSVEEFRKRIANTLTEYPYLAAEEDGVILGYAYAGVFHARPAYKHCVELSIYVRQDCGGRGVGKSLYLKLEEMLIKQNVYSVHACIAVPDGEDEHLTDDSEKFHRKMGFEIAGRHEKCGYKLGKWYTIIWMDKVIYDRPDNPPEFIPFGRME